MPIPDSVARTSIYMDRELMKEVDRLAELGGMSRSQFIETALEIVVESDGPLIDFSFRLGRIARRIWPKVKQKRSGA